MAYEEFDKNHSEITKLPNEFQEIASRNPQRSDTYEIFTEFKKQDSQISQLPPWILDGVLRYESGLVYFGYENLMALREKHQNTLKTNQSAIESRRQYDESTPNQKNQLREKAHQQRDNYIYDVSPFSRYNQLSILTMSPIEWERTLIYFNESIEMHRRFTTHLQRIADYAVSKPYFPCWRPSDYYLSDDSNVILESPYSKERIKKNSFVEFEVVKKPNQGGFLEIRRPSWRQKTLLIHRTACCAMTLSDLSYLKTHDEFRELWFAFAKFGESSSLEIDNIIRALS